MSDNMEENKKEINDKNLKPSARRLRKFDDDEIDIKFDEFKDSVRINLSDDSYRKLDAMSAVVNISMEKIATVLLDEKIMNIDVVQYVENILDLKLDKRYGYNSIIVKFSSESNRRLKIFAGVKNCSLKDLVVYYVEEIINEIDLVKFVKDEFK